MKYRVLRYDLSSEKWRVEELEAPQVLGPVDAGLKLHREAGSYEAEPLSERNPVLLGVGVFAGSALPGTNRLVAVFRSPTTKLLHVATAGGVGYYFRGCGVHAILVEGRCEEPCALVVVGDEGGVRDAWIEVIGWDRLRAAWSNYRGSAGVRGLTRMLLDNVEAAVEAKARPIVVGPAAARTISAAIAAVDVKYVGGRPRLGAVIDFAARGGGGSVMLRGHNLAAVLAGGSYEPAKANPKLGDRGLLERIFEEETGKPMGKAIHDATVKYRFDPKLGTGGTFGVNYVHYRDLIPMFAYNLVYYAKPVRERVTQLVLEYFWKPFQERVFGRARSWSTCGEPCPAVCKKLYDGTKVDYEPFNAMGPLIGVLRFEDARELVELVDRLGLDAIEAGHVVAWLFDALWRGLLEPADVAVDDRPFMDPIGYRVEEHSRRNAELAARLLLGLVDHETTVLRLVAERGIRGAAAELDELFKDRVEAAGLRFEDLAVYSAYGGEGYATPNYYWCPGVVAPIVMPERYWTYYSPGFAEPEEYAKIAYERAVNEYSVDNAGLCRFHRKWAEKLLPRLYAELWGVRVDLREHAREALRGLAEYARLAGSLPQPWESRKTMDMVFAAAWEVGAREWAERYARAPDSTAREWWSRFARAYADLLGAEWWATTVRA